MKKKITYILFAVACLCAAGCNSDFLKEYSQSLGRVQTVDDLKELLVGDCLLPKSLFSNESSSYQAENANFIFVHFMGDELQENLKTQENVDWVGYRGRMFPYFTWQEHLFIDKDGRSTYETEENKPWALAYERINNCNMVLEAAEQLKTASYEEAAEVQKVRGELFFLRASYYLMLVNLYGKPYSPATAAQEPAVPLKLTANVEDKDYERASVADVYAQVVADLSQAETLLATASAPLSIYHPGIAAVYVLRSRVALYMQDWQTAESYAQKALEQRDFLMNQQELAATTYPLSRLNAEVLFSNGASMLGNVLFTCPGRTRDEDVPTWYVSDNLYALFADDDVRKTTYVTTKDDLKNALPTYHKVDLGRESYGRYKEVSDVFAIRTAEAYLNMAEAAAQQGKDAEACRFLNLLRQKRIASNSQVQATGGELITLIREERERELFLEGHRWFDLRRYMVDEKHPFTKEIVHTMSTFKSEGYKSYRSNLSKYRLEKNDAAYTLSLPKQVRDFQPSIGTNARPDRKPFESQDFNAGGGDDDDNN